MNVGDYVRTEYGIIGSLYGNYAYDENQLAILTKSNENGVEYTQECSKNDIIKSSPNIIDLIEVGDYVNGQLVHKNDENNYLYLIGIDGDGNYYEDSIKDIKSIVTREQFSQMEYKIQ